MLLQYFTKAKGEFIMTENKTLKIVVIITGILTVLLGFYTLVRPLMTFLSIGWIFGIFLLINGIELVILSLSKEKKKYRCLYSWCSGSTCRYYFII